MKRWVVKAAGFVSRPLTLAEAATLADTLVDASDTFADVTIEFSHELCPVAARNVFAGMETA